MRDFKSFFLKRVPQKDRFLQGDKPTQDVFTRLFDSVGFISEVTDTAKTTEQGYVKLADNNSAKSFTTPQDGFAYAVQPNQLPETKAAPLSGSFGDPAMPLNTIDVVSDLTNPTRVTFLLRLKTEFIQWLSGRLLPGGGYSPQVLKRGPGVVYTAMWSDQDVLAPKDITASGIDYSRYNTTYTFAPGTGAIVLTDIMTNSYILKGNPDPYPGNYSQYGEFYRIDMDGGVTPGYQLRLKYAGGADGKPMGLFEYGAFPGNLDLGSFAYRYGGRRGILVNANDTLTFVYGLENKWILWDITPGVIDNLIAPLNLSVDFRIGNAITATPQYKDIKYVQQGKNVTIFFHLGANVTGIRNPGNPVADPWQSGFTITVPDYILPRSTGDSVIAGSYSVTIGHDKIYAYIEANSSDGTINHNFQRPNIDLWSAAVGQNLDISGFVSYVCV